jgi:hypothetical protein
MRRLGTALFLIALLCGHTRFAHADQAEVKEIARNNDCLPKKIEVYQQSLGDEGQTIYRVQCNMPKVVDEASKGPDELLISCRDTLCELLRPFEEPKK